MLTTMIRLARGGLPLVLAMCLLGILDTDTLAQSGPLPDWNRENDTLEGALGLHAGNVGGHGLSFRVPLKWYLYGQISGGVWSDSDDRYRNFGLQLHYLLRQDDRLRLFLSGGLGNFYHDEKTGPDQWEDANHWNTGAGVGIEFLQGVRWSWLAELDFVHEGEDDQVKVFPQLGIYYYW